MEQTEFLIKFEQVCGVKNPIFVDSSDTFAVTDESLKWAKDLRGLSIGRYRLTPQNSGVTEIWIDVDNKDGKLGFQELVSKVEVSIEYFMGLGIPKNCIYVKNSGSGFQIHVFMRGLPQSFTFERLIKTIGACEASLVIKHKIREFGAKTSTGNGFCSSINLESLKHKKLYPTIEKPCFPDPLNVFEATKEFLLNFSFCEHDIEQEKMEKDTIVDFERRGDITKFLLCAAIKNMMQRSHLTHPERFFLMSEYMQFGEAGRNKLHEIISSCTDYSREITQKFIDHGMQRGYLPCSCRYAREREWCPIECKGSGGKSPLSFVTRISSLQDLYKVFDEEACMTTETGEKDFELIDIHLIPVLDTKWTGDLAWMFTVAPSGAAKTLLIKSLSWNTYDLDTFTDKAFVSGLVIKRKDGTTEPIAGIADELHNKTMTVEDMSAMLSKRSETRDEVFGFLRNAYKGSLSLAHGTVKGKQKKLCRFGLLVGVTPVIDNYMALLGQLGERFLKIRSCLDEDLAAQKAQDKAFNGEDERSMKRLQAAVYTFMANLNIGYKVKCSDENKKLLRTLAFYVSRVRTSLLTDKGGGGLTGYIEYYTRLTTQFTRAAIILCWLRQKTEIGEDEIKTIARLAFDTPQAARTLILKKIYDNKQPISITELAKVIKATEYKARRVLSELEWLGWIERDASENYVMKEERIPIFQIVNKLGFRGWTDSLLERDSQIILKGSRKTPHTPNGKLVDFITDDSIASWAQKVVLEGTSQ